MSAREQRMFDSEAKINDATLHDNLITLFSYNKYSTISDPLFGFESGVQ
jgi:hypothetical protein